MGCDTGQAETRQEWSERPSGWCFRGLTRVENASLPLWKQRRTARFDCPSFSDFTRVANEAVSDIFYSQTTFVEPGVPFVKRHVLCLLQAVKDQNE